MRYPPHSRRQYRSTQETMALAAPTPLYASPAVSVKTLEAEMLSRAPSVASPRPPSVASLRRTPSPPSRQSWSAGSLVFNSPGSPIPAPNYQHTLKTKLSIRAFGAPTALLEISETYNFEDWNVAFKVEDTLYRVHKFFFKRESSVFAEMFITNPAGQPILLSGVSSPEFEALLDLMYSAAFEPEPMSVERWLLILHVSRLWSMTRIWRMAIKKIDELGGVPPVDKIVVAAKEDIQEWLVPAYVALVDRDEPLSIAEARKLMALGEKPLWHVAGRPVAAMDIVPLLAQARELSRRTHHQESYRATSPWRRHRASPSMPPSPQGATAALEIVMEVFGYPTPPSKVPSPAPSGASNQFP